MRNSIKLVLLAAFSAATVGTAQADLNQEMSDMFNGRQVIGNYTSPSSFTAQGQNYFVGGGVVARAPTKTLTPVNVQLPSFNAGCGGIDLHLGSISFAGVDAYKDFFLALPNQALGYGLKVGLDAISPTLSKAFNSIEDVVQKINSVSMNSCQAAQTLVNGLAGQLDVGDLARCKQRKVSSGAAQDFTDAEMQCKKEGAAANVPSSTDESLKPAAGNITWQALSKLNGLSKEDKELLMSLFGTVIIHSQSKPDKEGTAPKPLEPTLLTFQDFFHGQPSTTAGSSQLEVYRCMLSSDPECMTPVRVPITVQTFPNLVEARMTEIAENLINGTEQTPQAIRFINATQVPVFRLLVAATATGSRTLAGAFINNYRDVVAIELAVVYFDKLLTQAHAALNSGGTHFNEPQRAMLKQIIERAPKLIAAAREEERKLNQNLQARTDLRAELEALQKNIYARVPENVRRLMATR